MKFRILPAVLLAATLLAGCQLPFGAQTSNQNQPALSSETATAFIVTQQEAQQIALTHAGLTSDQVTRLNVNKDWDNGVAHYDVEFRYDGYDYDYEIHAGDGRILQHEKDRD